MGRQREFDLGRALAIATDLFWQQGYENTSVGQLTAAMGITPPSFYLAFKSKEALFRSAVATHQERQGKIIGAAFDEPDSRSLVRTLLSGFADDLTMPGRAQGCLILNNALPAAPDQSFRTEWADWRKRFRLRLQRRFKHDQARATCRRMSVQRRSPSSSALCFGAWRSRPRQASPARSFTRQSTRSWRPGPGRSNGPTSRPIPQVSGHSEGRSFAIRQQETRCVVDLLGPIRRHPNP